MKFDEKRICGLQGNKQQLFISCKTLKYVIIQTQSKITLLLIQRILWRVFALEFKLHGCYGICMHAFFCNVSQWFHFNNTLNCYKVKFKAFLLVLWAVHCFIKLLINIDANDYSSVTKVLVYACTYAFSDDYKSSLKVFFRKRFLFLG